MVTDRAMPIVHPVLVAVAPVLFLYSRNVHDFPWSVTLLPAAVGIAVALSLWWLVNRWFKDRVRSAILVTLMVFGFTVYGHLVTGLDAVLTTWPEPLLARRIMIAATGILFVFAGYRVARTRRSLHGMTRLLDVASGIFVVLSLGQIGLQTFADGIPVGSRPTGIIPESSQRLGVPASRPDIYYIILDGFAREDVLKEMYDYDHAKLYAYLRQQGFYVADQAFANYCQTMLSLASSLNGTHLTELTHRAVRITDRDVLGSMVRDSDVVRFLRACGYRWVSFCTGYASLDMPEADLYYEPPTLTRHLTEFQSGLLRTTLYAIIEGRLALIPGFKGHFREMSTGAHRATIDLTLSQLRSGFPLTEPVFVYAHLIAPHPPFVYGPGGEALDIDGPFSFSDGTHMHGYDPAQQAWYRQQYRDQLAYIEKQVIATIDAILARSDPPPIIIVQADHGPGSELDWDGVERTNLRERLGILNAYYLPDGGDTLLYPSISPVNTFCVVFNHYFGTEFELLKDRSYYSRWDNPYDFIDVTDRLHQSPPPPAGADDGHR